MQSTTSIHDKITLLRRSILLAALVRGINLVIAIQLVVFLMLALMDIRFRFAGNWYPFAAFITIVSLLVMTLTRYLVPLLWRRLSLVDVARHIEDRFGETENELSSATRFDSGGHNARLIHSSELENAVIRKASRMLEGLRLPSLIQMERIYLSIFAIVIALILGLVLFWLQPVDSQIAGTRILTPWKQTAWPRYYQLQFETQQRSVFYGDSIDIVIKEIQGRTPRIVEASIVWEKSDRTQIVPATADSEDPSRFHIVIENVTEPFRCQASGGDGLTEWMTVNVIPKINLKNVEVIVNPPGYTLSSPAISHGIIRATVGSQLMVNASVDQVVKKAKIRFETTDGTTTFGMDVGNEGKVLQLDRNGAPWILTESGVFSFELTDKKNRSFKPESRWEIVCSKDELPGGQIKLVEGMAKVSERASIDGMVTVTDDVGISSWNLSVSRQDVSTPRAQRIKSWKYNPDLLHRDPPKQFAEAFLLNLATLETPIHSVWEMELTVTDMKGQIKLIRSNSFEVATREQLLDHWNTELSEVIKRSRVALEQLKTTRTRLVLAEKSIQGEQRNTASEKHLLVLARDNLTQFINSINEQEHSPVVIIDQLLNRIERNNVELPGYVPYLAKLANSFRAASHRHARTHLSALAIANSHVGVNSESCLEQTRLVINSLTDSINRIQAELAYFDQWYETQSIRSDLSSFANEQLSLKSRTESVQLKTIGRRMDELPTDLRTQIANLAEKQARIHQNFLNFQSRLANGQSDDEQAERVKELLQELIRKKIADRMWQSAEELSQNKVGNGIKTQSELVQTLQEIVNRLDTNVDRTVAAAQSDQNTGQVIVALQNVRDRFSELSDKVNRFEKNQDAETAIDEVLSQYAQLQQDVTNVGKLLKSESQKALIEQVANDLQTIIENVGKANFGSQFQLANSNALQLLDVIISSLMQFDPPQKTNTEKSDTSNPDKSPVPDSSQFDARELIVVKEIQTRLSRESRELEQQRTSGNLSESEFAHRVALWTAMQKMNQKLINQILDKIESPDERGQSGSQRIPELPDF
jgi:hypothetical protein